ncbi:MAG TPA: hypothetical protein DD442_15425 [Halomonas sp.]|jgi:hypothetical protein|nr:hypothetical protein [Halomonas sp.]|tara:strand:- start:152 stop:382 length:231 start_codon:yes stop_codon:yes gene_type:complete
MCHPSRIPQKWIFIVSWIDDAGPYACATFANPEDENEMQDTQLLTGGKTVEEIALIKNIPVRGMEWWMLRERILDY